MAAVGASSSTTLVEPTAVPSVLIDLCSIAIFHRFSSPAWWDAVARRVCTDVSNTEGFEQVVRLKVTHLPVPSRSYDLLIGALLQTGRALVLCPTGLGLFPTTKRTASGKTNKGPPQIAQLGRRYMLIKTRQRVTVDGGASIMAVDV